MAFQGRRYVGDQAQLRRQVDGLGRPSYNAIVQGPHDYAINTVSTLPRKTCKPKSTARSSLQPRSIT